MITESDQGASIDNLARNARPNPDTGSASFWLISHRLVAGKMRRKHAGITHLYVANETCMLRRRILLSERVNWL